MTVAELIIRLQTLPQDAEVQSFEAQWDDFVPVVDVEHNSKEAVNVVRILTDFDKDV